MTIDVPYRLAVRRIAEQLHSVGDDALVGVVVTRTPSRGHRLAKVLEARLPMVHIVLFGVLLHERPDVVSSNRRVLKYRLHLREVGTELGGDANVTFDHAEQRTVDNCCDDLLLRHVPFLTFPRALPHFDNFNMTSNVCRMRFRVGQKLSHGLVVLRICFLWLMTFRTTVPERSMELISGARLCAPTVDRKFTYPLFTTISLMTDAETRSLRFAREPLDGHLSVKLCLLRTEPVLLPTTHAPSRR